MEKANWADCSPTTNTTVVFPAEIVMLRTSGTLCCPTSEGTIHNRSLCK